MSVKILVLKSGEDVIADVQEMVSSDEKVIGYFLTKPCVVKLINSNPITKEETDPKSEKKSEFSVTMYHQDAFSTRKINPAYGRLGCDHGHSSRENL